MLNLRPIFVIFAAQLTVSASAQGLPDELAGCRALAGNDERLACYDAFADRQSAPVAPESEAVESTAAVALVPAAERLSQEELFGLTGEEVKRTYEEAAGQQELKELSATVTDVQPAGPGRIIVWLDNGQVWRQTDSPTLKIKVGGRVIIRKAAFGSFKMKKEDENATMRVRREK